MKIFFRVLAASCFVNKSEILYRGLILAMAYDRERTKLSLAEDIHKTEKILKDMKEVINDKYKDINEKTEHFAVKLDEFEKCQIKARENIKQNLEYLEKLIEDLPDQLDLNEKLLEDIIIKIRGRDKNNYSNSVSDLPKKRFCKQKLRTHMARIKKKYPEKSCFIQGEELFLNGKVFYFSDEKKKLVRRSRSEKTVEEQDSEFL